MSDSVSGLLTLHDIFLTCLKHYTPKVPVPSPGPEFWKYFENNWWTAPYHFRRSMQLNADKFTYWRSRHVATPCIQEYVGLLTENSDPIAPDRLTTLRAVDFTLFAEDAVALFCLVEAHEIACRQYDGDERVPYAEKAILQIDSVIGKIEKEPICANLHHHRGKFLRYAKRFADMNEAFSSALAMDSTAYQTHLQLARIALRDKQWADTKGHIQVILDAYIEDEFSVAITLVLDAYSMLGERSLSRFREARVDNAPEIIEQAIRVATVQGYLQPYQTVVRLAKSLSYEHPELVLRLTNTLAVPAVESIKQREMFMIGEFLKERIKAIRWNDGGKDVAPELCGEARRYYDNADLSKAYELQMYSELLLIQRDFGEAIVTVHGV